MIFLGDQLLSELKKLTKEAYPQEAVGLILPNSQVVSLPNRSPSPETNFSVNKEDILSALLGVEDLSTVVLWHSHPQGGIGPSRFDIKQKTPLPYHLVISLVEEDIVASWY